MQNNKPNQILIIEDDESTAMLLQYMLEREGFTVVVAYDGLQAEAIINMMKSPPAIVLLDVLLPYVDGMQLLQKIRRLTNWKRVPVLMLTGKSLADDMVRAFKLGADDYIVKPIYLAELLARIHRFILTSAAQKSRIKDKRK